MTQHQCYIKFWSERTVKTINIRVDKTKTVKHKTPFRVNSPQNQRGIKH
jgi:hypothetical protein